MDKKYIINIKGNLSVHSAIIALERLREDIEEFNVDTWQNVKSAEVSVRVFEEDITLIYKQNAKSITITAYYENEAKEINNATETDTI